MDDLISRREAINKVQCLELETAYDNEKVEEMLRELPPVQPMQKMGKWIYDGDGIICSKCKKAYDFISIKMGTLYCANCGAKMEEDKEDKCKNCEYYHNPDYTRCHECKAGK